MNHLRYLTLLISLFLFHSQDSIAQSDEKPVNQTKQYELFNRILSDSQRFNLHFQVTYINQTKPRMRSLYSDSLSLLGPKENQNSMTATAFIGVKLWKGGYVFVNPEVAGGSGLSGAQGMGGSSNGETFRVGNPSPTLYLARAYIEQTFPLSKKTEEQVDDENQLEMQVPDDYLKITVGKFSLADMFDNNEMSNTPRTQFMNWALMNNGSWDFAANVRGYTYIAAAELDYGFLNYKLAFANLPKVANGADLNTKISQELAINAQVTAKYKIKNYLGHLGVLYFNNKADMGDYAEALAIAKTSGNIPSVINTRQQGRHKYGFGLNVDQELPHDIGLFGRFGWNNGKTETWNFTEIDNTASVGANVNGGLWHRIHDVLGLAVVSNGLSKDHRDYLAAGGYGFILGDGKLNYARENVLEFFYNFKPTDKPLWITGDYQLGVNPGYNKDRGPANIFSLRVHTEF
ncbi:MAG: carbohydrate porin [Pseudopedobacter saltans]|uniref:Carbohydrate porin n=1 Tax=Pseudopedobacter saltans TaxID=151895 RepID=A0A2W5FB77_9SPHI|nr:MAG: carbohydrate porin [Pseudopedobacter saltans]